MVFKESLHLAVREIVNLLPTQPAESRATNPSAEANSFKPVQEKERSVYGPVASIWPVRRTGDHHGLPRQQILHVPPDESLCPSPQHGRKYSERAVHNEGLFAVPAMPVIMQLSPNV